MAADKPSDSPTPAKPSTIKLTTFAIFRSRKGPDGVPVAEVLHGASDVRFNPGSGKLELLADSVPFNSERFKKFAPKHGHGLLMLYGIRDALEELQKWRAKARGVHAEFATAEIEFEVGEIEVGLTGRDLLRQSGDKSRFLNLRRMKADLQKNILDNFMKYAAEDGMDVKESMSRASQIAMRPDYFDRLFQDFRDMRFLDILIIPVADSEEGGPIPRIRQVAYVRPGARVIKTIQSRDDVDILLPAWMTDAKAAAAHRKLLTQDA